MGKPYQGFQTPAMAKAGQTSGFKGPSVKKKTNKKQKKILQILSKHQLTPYLSVGDN